MVAPFVHVRNMVNCRHIDKAEPQIDVQRGRRGHGSCRHTDRTPHYWPCPRLCGTMGCMDDSGAGRLVVACLGQGA